MEANLPTTPGPYFWREKDGDKWEPVYIREDSTVPGYEFTVLFPETGTEIDLPCMQGQWAKAHSPDEGVEAWAVFNQFGDIVAADDTWAGAWFSAARLAGTEQDFLRRGGYTCEPVTIVRKAKI